MKAVSVPALIVTALLAACAPVRPQPAAQEVSGESWAVIIGVGQSQDTGLPRRKYAVADAEAVYKLLTTIGGFKRGTVLLLTDRSQVKPTLRNIAYALRTFLPRSAKPDDTVVIYFSGPGAAEGLTRYLLPSDADPKDLFSTAVPLGELAPIIDGIQGARVVVFIEANYSGAVIGRTFAAPKPPAGTPDNLSIQQRMRLMASRGRAIVAASRRDEVALESDGLGHGLFTYYLLEGLRGSAVRGDDIVKLADLFDYVTAEVSMKARSLGGSQHPVLRGEIGRDGLPLIHVPRP